MKHSALICAIAFVPISAGVSSVPTFSPPDPFDASLIRLIANPDLFDGKRVRIYGYMKLEFEGESIYLHREDYDHHLFQNALWLQYELKGPRALSGRYVLIEGTFSAKAHGHLGLWPGSVVKITRCQAW